MWLLDLRVLDLKCVGALKSEKLYICCRSANGNELLSEQEHLSHFSIYLYCKSCIQNRIFVFIFLWQGEKAWSQAVNLMLSAYSVSLHKGKTYFNLFITHVTSISIFVFLKSNWVTTNILIKSFWFCFFLEKKTKQNKNRNFTSLNKPVQKTNTII